MIGLIHMPEQVDGTVRRVPLHLEHRPPGNHRQPGAMLAKWRARARLQAREYLAGPDEVPRFNYPGAVRWTTRRELATRLRAGAGGAGGGSHLLLRAVEAVARAGRARSAALRLVGSRLPWDGDGVLGLVSPCWRSLRDVTAGDTRRARLAPRIARHAKPHLRPAGRAVLKRDPFLRPRRTGSFRLTDEGGTPRIGPLHTLSVLTRSTEGCRHDVSPGRDD